MSDLNIPLDSLRAPDPLRAFKARTARQHEAGSLRLITYNIQVGISSQRFRHYLTHSWKHVLPHAGSFENLDRIARSVNEFDIVALQEADAGSFRSLFINQVEYLAHRGHFPYWYYQTNRNFGKIAQHSNGLLSRLMPSDITEHRLPGFIPGRGLLEVHYGRLENPLVLLLVHLGLSRRARLRQIAYVARLVNRHRHVVVMGDFNCRTDSREMQILHAATNLCEPADKLPTFPSWRPYHNIDHILVTPDIKINEVQVLPHSISDHLPIAVDIHLPEGVAIDRRASRALHV